MDNMQDLQNNEVEKAVLRLLINKIDLLAEIDGRLISKDFYSLANQTIFTALLEMYDQNINVDLITLAEYLNKKGRLDNVGSITYLTDLYDGIMNKAGINEYVKIIKDLSDRRFMWKLAQTLKNRVHDRDISPYELSSKLLWAIENMQQIKQEDKADLIDAYENITSDKKMGIDIGYPELDYTLKGLKSGNLVILAGRPAMGKTAMALNIIANMTSAGQKVLFFSLEMSAEEIYTRLIRLVAKMPEKEIKAQLAKDNATKNNVFSADVESHRNNESKAFWERLHTGMEKIYSWDLGIVESGRFRIQDMRMRAKIQKARKGLDCIVIDYLQLMSAEGFNNNRVGEISYITRQLKLLAKELEIPILVLSQLSRAVENRSDKRPTLSDLRESGSIEQDADVVLLMYRDMYYNANGDPWTEIIIAKNRHGGTTTARLQFYPEISKFYNYNGIGGKAVKNEFPR